MSSPRRPAGGWGGVLSPNWEPGVVVSEPTLGRDPGTDRGRNALLQIKVNQSIIGAIVIRMADAQGTGFD